MKEQQGIGKQVDEILKDYECDGQIDIWEWMEEKEQEKMPREDDSDKILYVVSGRRSGKTAILIREVLNEIKAEIETYYADCSLSISENDDNCKRCNDTTFNSILRIIDKHIKGV